MPVQCEQCSNRVLPNSSTVIYRCDKEFASPLFLPTLLRSNDLPSSSDILSLKARQAEVRASLAELDVAIAKLEAERTRIQEISSQYDTVLSPTRRVPLEILTDIFIYAVESNPSFYNTFDLATEPWSLSHVCRTWRVAALNFCPRIWNSMSIHTPMLGEMVKRDYSSMLSTALDRANHKSEGYVFHLSVSESTEADEAVANGVLDLLLQRSRSWEDARLSIPLTMLPMLSAATGKLDTLTCCHIYLADIWPQARDMEIDFLSAAPNLKEVVLKGFGEGPLLRLQTSQLMEFADDRQVGRQDIQDNFLSIIQNAPNLVIFGTNYRKEGVILPVQPRIIHPRIHRFTACEDALLQSVEFPGLRSFELAPSPGTFTSPRDSLSGLHTLIANSHCSLQHLKITNTFLDEFVVPILEMTPRLKQLQFSLGFWVQGNDSVIKDIVLRMGQSTPNKQGLPLFSFLPTLSFLGVTISDMMNEEIDFVDDDFVAMIKARRDLSPKRVRLSKVALKAVTPSAKFKKLSDEGIRVLKDCKAKGVDIDIKAAAASGQGDKYICYV
ncbi:uncharacterized protein BT62DRAFT_796032 [Guyanagaster necrorhizus]|uniref:F-box domain-containing protein n=1 Tax=Guyanagaster necrorhizus TaxID=856835 RepID=A0A9P7VWQ2_9AGAR|nr:uncharacterized protein BT62DRAFT_796032 [Guyanagaster necrorhizus MCA 3950]KAG7447840.1 hypothetical protein BT62DRAFT_796032 [Guyanagaster necrorhizus MCA 3950]